MFDAFKEHAAVQPDSSIILHTWDGTPWDEGLVGLIPFVDFSAIHNVPDVRPILTNTRDMTSPRPRELSKASKSGSRSRS
ncbi:hypothetical protein CALVIDRAFT_567490 [Calocera viscosa TUFC12733]|uniref:Uncharacterized protein n=1 Tax=Calocera viscosa (strain TUFC12733) TaxID=1330018 RepID=A0A167I3F3_CALVF|nr:hypothetical protein CALVIDRAFT_567490 [Calocera viscosa TUFC12733]